MSLDLVVCTVLLEGVFVSVFQQVLKSFTQLYFSELILRIQRGSTMKPLVWYDSCDLFHFYADLSK